MKRFLVLAAAGMILAACGGGGSNDNDATATATSRRLPATTPVSTAGIATPNPTQVSEGTSVAAPPTETQVFIYCETDVPEASATPSSVQTLPVGHACIPDAGSDVKSEAGEPAVSPVAGSDIAAARIDSNGSVLLVTFYSNERIPVKIQSGSAITWHIELLQGGQPVYELSIALQPGDWDVIITDSATRQQQKLTAASIYNKRLETPFPAENLPKLTGPFTYRMWTESSSVDGVPVFDWAPDAAGVNRDDPAAAIPFPQ